MVKYLFMSPTWLSLSYMHYLAVSEIKVFNFTQSLFHLLTLTFVYDFSSWLIIYTHKISPKLPAD